MARLFVARRLSLIVAASAVALTFGCTAKPAGDTASKAGSSADSTSQPWTGDFDGMFERRHIRMVVPYSRTLFFVEDGKEHGLTADLAHDFETYLNQKHADELGGRPIKVTVMPTTRDRLLSELAEGRADIAGGNLTATALRMQTADFVAPVQRDPAVEMLVSGPGAPGVTTLNDLSGKTVNVRQASSYFESLNALNEKLGAANKPSVKIVPMSDALEDEDMLELLNAGLFDFTVVDSWKAKLWAQALPHIKVHENVVLRTGGTIGWAMRKQSPKLQAELEGFYKTASQQGLIEARLATYQTNLKAVADARTGPAAKKFEQTLALFRKYGKQYPFDPLMMVADGYDPALGDGQVAQDVQAATKHIDEVMAKNFADAKFSELDRTLFIFASHKNGAENLARMRTEAAKRGLDPNQWFNNVELVTTENYGMESTAYVRNILKCRVAYEFLNKAAPVAAK